ncbi:MAG: hypothetical protein JSR99_13595 [Proteobacteria bacterium]|nr:hypothetical protein [Pseudomonadota bacterium]
MQRQFEEVGVEIAGVGYGHFRGEAQWDEFGQVVVIEVETAECDGHHLELDIAQLVKERIALRQKYGTGFLEATDRDVCDHARKWFLFQGLSDALQDSFAEDVRDYLEDIRADASARRRRGAA